MHNACIKFAMLWALCQPFLYMLSRSISSTPLCNTLFYENPNMSKSMKPKFKKVQQFAPVQTIHKCKARPDCRAQHLPTITQACFQIIVLHSIGSGKQAFMIKITFVYHTLPTFLRLYFYAKNYQCSALYTNQGQKRFVQLQKFNNKNIVHIFWKRNKYILSSLD